MHVPTNNPTAGGPSGRSQRNFSGNTRAIRNFRSDTATEHSITTLREWLKGKILAGDVVSVSLLAKRAINVYRSHVAALSPQGLEQEKLKVRASSQMPSPNPRKRSNRSKKTTPQPQPFLSGAPVRL